MSARACWDGRAVSRTLRGISRGLNPSEGTEDAPIRTSMADQGIQRGGKRDRPTPKLAA
jgi:hypothetical protein